jgi:hypothetical protein
MTQLTNDQLKILTEINSVRLAVSNEFRNAESPSSEIMLRELLRLEVLLM